MDGAYLKRAYDKLVAKTAIFDLPPAEAEGRWPNILYRLICRLRGHDPRTNSKISVWRDSVMVTVRQTCFRCGRERKAVMFGLMGPWK